MRDMKNSGTDWLGQIPDSWQIGKIGQIYTERHTKVSDTNYAPLSVTMQGIVPQLSNAAKTDAHDDRKLVCKGDFAINSRSDRRGSCGISAYDGSVSLINTILAPRGEMNPLYFNWLFHTSEFASEFYKWGHGIVDDLWTTNWNDMKRIQIPIPPLPEQQIIAEFIERKCSDIDNVIEKTKNSIEEYKRIKQAIITEAITKGIRGGREMQRSKYAWINSIPKDWRTIRIKNACWLKGRIGWDGLTSSEYKESGPFLITGTDFSNGKINWETCVHISEERYAQDTDIHIYNGDLLITKDGTIGKVAVVSNCPEKVSLNSGVLLIRNTKGIKYCQDYLYFIIKSDLFWTWYELSQTGNSTIKHLYQEQFYNFAFPFPDFAEQEEISRFLYVECEKIDSLIESKEKFIKELSLYKKSFIYEYVTGKKEVE